MSSRRAIPGLPLSLGYTLFYLTLLVLIPLAALVLKSVHLTWHDFWSTISEPNTVAAYKLTFGVSAVAAVINGFFGLIVAWVLVRYSFWGRRLLDALIDLPFALPTAVAGLTFSSLYTEHGWMGRTGLWLGRSWMWKPLAAVWNGLAWGLNHVIAGISWVIVQIDSVLHHIIRFHIGPIDFRVGKATPDFLVLSNTTGGILIVLIFVGLPFVVRSVQPVLQDWDSEYEQAARSLGASKWTTFRRVIFPAIFPAWLGGFALAFARAVGEYGSVVFISANKPGESQIAPQVIIDKLYGLDANGESRATAVAVVLLVTSLLVLLLINAIEYWSRRHEMRR